MCKFISILKTLTSANFGTRFFSNARTPNKWSAVKLVIKICLCAPCSNASLERFFNQLKIVKTDQRTTLSDNSLNSILRIKLRGNSVTEFNNMCSDSVLKHWYNQKPRRIHQKRRKEYRKRKSAKKSRASKT